MTANLHITTLGHGYASHTHTDHSCESSNAVFRGWQWLLKIVVMNMSHVITEFSFGPYFPDITQPLDYSFEVAQGRGYYLCDASYRA